MLPLPKTNTVGLLISPPSWMDGGRIRVVLTYSTSPPSPCSSVARRYTLRLVLPTRCEVLSIDYLYPHRVLWQVRKRSWSETIVLCRLSFPPARGRQGIGGCESSFLFDRMAISNLFHTIRIEFVLGFVGHPPRNNQHSGN